MDTSIDQLQAAFKLLHLIHHRNKNQHRQSIWWKWLAMLERSIGKLTRELEAQDSRRVQARLKYMKDILVPKCYLAFTQLVQDNQFSALGLTLVAEVANVRRVISADSEDVEVRELVDTKYSARPTVSEDIGEAVGRPTANTTPLGYESSNFPCPNHISNSQKAETIERRVRGSKTAVFDVAEDIDIAAALLPNEREVLPAVGRRKFSAMRAKKPKRNPANPIDDLFQGLD